MTTPKRFETVSKADPLFKKYLLGQLPDFRALPTRSLNVGKHDESITFELKPIAEVACPGWLQLVVHTIKLKTFLLILVPLFFILVKNLIAGTIMDPLSLGFAFVAMSFIFAGLNMQNDIADHLSGFDRVNLSYGTKPIVLGWVSAHQLSIFSWLCIGFGIVLALPVFLLQPRILPLIGVTLPLILAGQFFKRNWYKEKEIGELILFLLMGTGVSAGFQLSLGMPIDMQIILFGVFWGSVVLFLVHVNNFSHLLTTTQAGIKNSLTALGFDRAKIFLAGWWAVCLILWTWFHIQFAMGIWKWLGVIFLVAISIPWFLKLLKVPSPLGSDLSHMRRKSYTNFLAMVAIFFIEQLWYVWSL